MSDALAKKPNIQYLQPTHEAQNMEQNAQFDLCIIGGAGHVGLPLAVAFANAGVRTAIYDIDAKALATIASGVFPFKEENGDAELKKALAGGTLHASSNPEVISQSAMVLTVVGTPIDEHLNPDFSGILRVISSVEPHFCDGQVLILRSTVFPGTTEHLKHYFTQHGKDVRLAFCPERIVQGHSLKELAEIAQIVSAFDDETAERVVSLFKKITKHVIRTEPTEAELAKLFSNAWRYICFAVANQFHMIAEEKGLDYNRIFRAMKEEYPRNKDLPSPGFAAGPCLLKDTMQLAAYANNTFFLGHSAMLVNEGLPAFMIKQLKKEHHLKQKTVGILGMAFKANNDDKRESLSYKLKKIAEIESRRVLCHDPYIADDRFHPLEKVIVESDIIILATPHNEYRSIDPSAYPDKTFVDIWNILCGSSSSPRN